MIRDSDRSIEGYNLGGSERWVTQRVQALLVGSFPTASRSADSETLPASSTMLEASIGIGPSYA